MVIFEQVARVSVTPDGIVSLEMCEGSFNDSLICTALDLLVESARDKGADLEAGDGIRLVIERVSRTEH